MSIPAQAVAINYGKSLVLHLPDLSQLSITIYPVKFSLVLDIH